MYSQNLAGKTYLYVYGNEYFEVSFPIDHFLHLTGIETRLSAKDFYKDSGNEKRAEIFSEIIGIEPEYAKVIFLDLFLYTHGIAVLAATKKLRFERDSAEKMVGNILTAFVRQVKPEWNLPVDT